MFQDAVATSLGGTSEFWEGVGAVPASPPQRPQVARRRRLTDVDAFPVEEPQSHDAAERPGEAGQITDEYISGAFARAFGGPCLAVNHGYWSYEICPGTSVRQMHLNAQQEVETVYSLGAWDAEKNQQPGPGRLRAAERPVQGERRSQFFVQHYSGGTRCDETNQGRASRVLFGCPADKTVRYTFIEVSCFGVHSIPARMLIIRPVDRERGATSAPMSSSSCSLSFAVYPT